MRTIPDKPSGFDSPPCKRPDGKRIRPFGCGAGPGLFLPPLSPGSQFFGCSSAAERLTVNQDVVGSTPTSRARNERKNPGECPWEYIA